MTEVRLSHKELADLLESMGFTVEPDHETANESSVSWVELDGDVIGRIEGDWEARWIKTTLK